MQLKYQYVVQVSSQYSDCFDPDDITVEVL